MLVRHHLNLDVTRTVDVTLEVHVAIFESSGGFGRSSFQRAAEFSLGMDDPHAAATTAARGFHNYRIANLFRDSRAFIRRLDRALAAGKNRHAGFLHRITRGHLFAHQLNNARARADEFNIAGLADFGEVSRLSQEPIAGMNRVDIEKFGGADDCRNVQVTLGGRRRPDAK